MLKSFEEDPGDDWGGEADKDTTKSSLSIAAASATILSSDPMM